MNKIYAANTHSLPVFVLNGPNYLVLHAETWRRKSIYCDLTGQPRAPEKVSSEGKKHLTVVINPLISLMFLDYRAELPFNPFIPDWILADENEIFGSVADCTLLIFGSSTRALGGNKKPAHPFDGRYGPFQIRLPHPRVPTFLSG